MRIKAALMVLLAVVASAAGQTGGVSVTVKTTPNPLGLGQNRFDATVMDARGRPIANAEVTLSLVMPADPKTKHPEMRTEGKLNSAGAGHYNGIALVSMAGTWHITVRAVRDGKTIGQARVTRQAHAIRPPATKRSRKPT